VKLNTFSNLLEKNLITMTTSQISSYH